MITDKPPAPGLIRALGPWTSTAIVVGGIIGSGIFKKPAAVAGDVPFSGVAALVWITGGLVALLGALAIAEVAVLFPHAGGNYVFLRDGYGRLAGFLWGWVEFGIIRSAGLAALATMFAEALGNILGNPAFQDACGLHLGTQPLGFWGEKGVILGVIAALAFVNILGVRRGGGLMLGVTLIKVGTLTLVPLAPFLVAMLGSPRASAAPDRANLLPIWPDATAGHALGVGSINFTAFGAAMVAVLWAYHGWMDAAPVAGEIRDPQRNIPLAMILGVIIVIALYLAANLGYYLVFPQAEIAAMKDTTVVAEFAQRLIGPIGAAAASAAVMCSVFGALNGNILVTPRLLYAMGEDRLAPRALGAVHPRFCTPAVAIVTLAVWSMLLVLLGAFVTSGKSLFDLMSDYAIFGAATFETLAVSTIFVFRRRFPEAERPYRCWGYPFVPALHIVLMVLVLINMFVKQTTEAVAGVGFIVAGVGVYGLFLRSSVPGRKLR
jgi:basic amino acid/polyamine antiporter, APA family